VTTPGTPTRRRFLSASGRWAGTPACIQVVRSAAETITAVQRAYDAGRRTTVRGGGHCYENFSAGNDGGVLIDLSGLDHWDPHNVCNHAQSIVAPA
jgi:FAD/FMN-containing dehydrogenase